MDTNTIENIIYFNENKCCSDQMDIILKLCLPKKVISFIVTYCDILHIDASDFFNSMIMASLLQLYEYRDDDETDSILKEIGVQ